jgi:hypothetical protein
MRLRAIVGLAIAVVVSVLFAPAAAANAEPGGYGGKCSSLAVSTTNPLPGQEITVSGQDFQPNASVRLELHTTVYVLGTVTTDSSGSFETTVTLPDGVTGTHTIVAATGSLGGSNCPAQPVQVIHIQTGGQSSGGGGNGGTSFTGVDVAAMLIGAAVLIVAGAVFNRGGRRRSYADR